MVWACRSCNSSKRAMDVLEWLDRREPFPPLLLLRRYLKIRVEHCEQHELMSAPLDWEGDLPFRVSAIPHDFPPPKDLVLWVV
jgi:hypothetical protein